MTTDRKLEPSIDPAIGGRRSLLLRVEHHPNQPIPADLSHAGIASGIDGIELDMNTPLSDLIGDRRLSSCLAEKMPGIRAFATHCDTCEIDRATQEVADLLRQLSSLGVICLSLTLPPVISTSDEIAFTSYQNSLNFAYELMHSVRHEAEAVGVALALEPGANGNLLSPVEFRDLIDAANSWAIGACVDVDRLAAVGSAADWLFTLRHRVHAVRLPESTVKNVTSITGLDSLAATLDEMGYQGPVILTGVLDQEAVDLLFTKLISGREPLDGTA